MKSDLNRELEKLYIQIGKPKDAQIFCIQLIADYLGETVEILGQKIPVVASDVIPENKTSNQWQSDLYMVSGISKERFEKHEKNNI